MLSFTRRAEWEAVVVERRDLVCPVRPEPRKLDLLVVLVPVVVAMSDRLDEVREMVVPLRPD